MSGCLLFLGYRAGAIDAAVSLGHEFIIWHDKPLPKRIALQARSSYQAPFPDDFAKLPKGVDQWLQATPIASVLALMERSVLLAAFIRQRLGLQGVSLEVAKRCQDKFWMKTWAADHGIPTTRFLVTDLAAEAEEWGKTWGYPLIAKPRTSSGRRGLQYIYDSEHWIPENTYLEKIITGHECSVESYIINGEIKFTNITDYFALTYSNILPAEYTPALMDALLGLNARIIRAFEITEGMIHCEFYITKQGLLFGEIAIRPPGGYIMDLLSMAYQVSAWELFILSHLGHEFPKPAALKTAACWIVHPGPGQVAKIQGLETIAKHPAVEDIKIRCQQGEICQERIGVGQDYGRILLAATSYAHAQEALHFIEQHFTLDVQPI
jgi:biotin carboxylase